MSKEAKEVTGNFQDLLKAINEADSDTDTLAKPKGGAPEKDDKNIKAAATDSDDDADDKEGQEPAFAKSMSVKDADGNDMEVIDAGELLKSMQDQLGLHETVLAKGLTSLVGTVKKQGDLIKSMQETITSLSGQGRGRKAVFMAIDKPDAGGTMAKSQGAAADGQITADEFFAKADAAFAGGKITGQEANTIDVCRRMGQVPSADLIRKVALAS